jgi:cbb3-type cytochrome oxidase subunit 3
VNSIKDYFHTDWGSMTQHDWIGLTMTIVVFFVMVGLYVYVFHPSNKERLESQRHIPLDDGLDLNQRLPDHFPGRSTESKGSEDKK